MKTGGGTMDNDRGIRRVSTYRADSSLLLLGRLRLATETFDLE